MADKNKLSTGEILKNISIALANSSMTLNEHTALQGQLQGLHDFIESQQKQIVELKEQFEISAVKQEPSAEPTH